MTSPNIILIVLDTLRADAIDLLEAEFPEFVSVKNVIAPAPWTLPSHVSIFTGLYPSIHGSHETVDAKCDDITKIRNKMPTFTTELRELGYHTVAFSSNIFVSPTYGFHGFDSFENWRIGWPQLLASLPPSKRGLFRSFLHSRSTLDGAQVALRIMAEDRENLPTALRMIIQHVKMRAAQSFPKDKGVSQAIKYFRKLRPPEPFFLFINLMEAHEPYFKSDNLVSGLSPCPTYAHNQTTIRRWIRGYEFQVAYLVAKLRQLMDLFESKGMLQNTLVIVTSDHGQLLGEHGLIGHGVFLYDELVRVPMLVKYPENPAVDGTNYYSLVDLGKLIMNAASGKGLEFSFDTEVYSESWGFYEKVSPTKTGLARKMGSSLTDRRVCLYSDGNKVTYNATQDVFEEVFPLRRKDNENLSALKEKCMKFAKGATSPVHVQTPLLEPVDEELILDQLRRLGYA